FVQIGITHAPVLSSRRKSFLARAIQRYAPSIFDRLSLPFGPNACNASMLLNQPFHAHTFEDGRALCSRILGQHLIELRAQHLPGLRDRFAIIPVEEIKRL